MKSIIAMFLVAALAFVGIIAYKSTSHNAATELSEENQKRRQIVDRVQKPAAETERLDEAVIERMDKIVERTKPTEYDKYSQQLIDNNNLMITDKMVRRAAQIVADDNGDSAWAVLWCLDINGMGKSSKPNKQEIYRTLEPNVKAFCVELVTQDRANDVREALNDARKKEQNVKNIMGE